MYVITDQVDEAARLAPEPARRISRSFKNLGWAGHFTPADANALAAVSTTINAPAGTEIVVEGDDPGCIYLVTDGWLYAGRSLADGRQHIPALMLPGEVCNLDSIQLARADHTVAALTRTRLEKIGTASLLHVAWERPAVAAQLLRLLSAETRLRTAWALRPRAAERGRAHRSFPVRDRAPAERRARRRRQRSHHAAPDAAAARQCAWRHLRPHQPHAAADGRGHADRRRDEECHHSRLSGAMRGWAIRVRLSAV